MRLATSIAALALLAGCATDLAPQPASFETVVALREASFRSVALGEFKPGPELPHNGDKSIAVRADSFRAPSGSFSTYLRDTIRDQLASAGKLDDSRTSTLSAELTQSEVETSLPTSSATLSARFTVTSPNGPPTKKTLTVTDEWPSSFFGVVAITEAGQRYSALYQALANAVFSDPDIMRALSGNGPNGGSPSTLTR